AFANETPVVTVSPSVVSLRKGAKVTIAGSGFPKKKEIGIRVVLGGVISEIRTQVKPEPTVNDQGTFYTEWTFDGEQNLLPPGAASLSVVDEDGKVLAHTPVVWMKEAKKEAKAE
ncbi:MAG: hypothetical protein OEN50_15355, partial [Deltaproteobacteria bacterium]|nr:hypothetical protein [Deltaproteobacteria bacterium]